mmetsp:Transcript_10372/g.25435  ORF Transcript_10372/g.25435 Transcript_10372/m.25435 type:complete len:285 (+) Transcript_10372:28-882(+)
MSRLISSSRISEVVQRYDDSLNHNALLKRENHALKEIIRGNEIKTMRLIEHYKNEIDAQSGLVAKFKDELRARERMELLDRQQNFRDQSTWIEEDELQSKEKEMLAVIYMLEDEIQSLKDAQLKQTQDFERKTLANEANVKQSFMQDIDAFRNEISNSVCDEVRGALADTVGDNERLTREFRLLLDEMEKLQVSRDKKDRELSKTKRELDFLMQKNHLMASRIQCQTDKVNGDVQSEAADVVEDTCRSKRKAAVGSTLEDYFKQCIKNQRAESARHKRNSRISL